MFLVIPHKLVLVLDFEEEVLKLVKENLASDLVSPFVCVSGSLASQRIVIMRLLSFTTSTGKLIDLVKNK